MPLEDFLAVAECGDRAIPHDGNLVRSGENTHSMGDDDHRGIGDLHLFNGIQEHAFADVVEAGVRLVEHHKARAAKKGPRKTDTSILSSRTRPCVGNEIPAMIWPSIDLPEPDGPMMPRHSPGAIPNETPFSRKRPDSRGATPTLSTMRPPCG